MQNKNDFFRNTGHNNYDYSGQHLNDVGGKNLTFVDCNFSYALLERAYLHHAKFIRCKFVGTRFFNCNLRSATFDLCSFEYAIFDRTVVDEKQIVLNLPLAPNQCRDLVRILRVNALSMGDYEAANSLLSAEMRASSAHHYGVFKYSSAYYRSKYSQRDRITSFLKYYGLKFEDSIWGYGVSPLRLFIVLITFTSALGVLLGFLTNGWPTSSTNLLNSALDNIGKAHLGLLDLSLVDSGTIAAHRTVFSLIVAARTIALGLFISVLYRRYAR